MSYNRDLSDLAPGGEWYYQMLKGTLLPGNYGIGKLHKIMGNCKLWQIMADYGRLQWITVDYGRLQ